MWLSKIWAAFLKKILMSGPPSDFPAPSHWQLGHRHMPHGLDIRLDTNGGTVFAQPNKFEHHFHVIYNFRYQTDCGKQVEAHLALVSQTNIDGSTCVVLNEMASSHFKISSTNIAPYTHNISATCLAITTPMFSINIYAPTERPKKYPPLVPPR